MEQLFVRGHPQYDRILLVLTLDRKKMKERILVGEEQQIRFRLEGSEGADVVCDVMRPLGAFIENFVYDPQGEWNLSGLGPLRDALHTNRWKQPALAQRAGDFLRAQYETGDPVRMYAALRIWNGYLLAREPRDRSAACDRLMAEMGALTSAFHGEKVLDMDPETGRPRPLDLGQRFFGRTRSTDARLDLWYPAGRQSMECVAAYASFYPLIIYYLNRLREWGLFFRKCKVCGKIFLAASQRYELCSDKCRKAQALQNKRDFDERARENNYDLLYKNECQSWRNKIKKAEKIPDFPPERLETMCSAFDAFKKEALVRKKAVKGKTASPKEFSDWLFQQSSIIVGLLEI